jgi:transcription termination/antitermination protein NusG
MHPDPSSPGAEDLLIARWYVLHTRSRFENVVHEGLARKQVEAYVPKITVRSKRRDRRQMIQVPLFPGYVFVRSDLNPYHQLEIVRTVGVVRFIANRQGPLPVGDETIASLKIMVDTDRQIITGRRLRCGDRVMVVTGPMTGVVGSFVRYRGRRRVVVNIEALGQYAAVEIDADAVEPLAPVAARKPGETGHHLFSRRERS